MEFVALQSPNVFPAMVFIGSLLILGFTKSIRSIWVSVGSQISAAATAAFRASTHPFPTASLDVDMSIA